MALAVTDKRISEEDYLAGELISGTKHEYIAGSVYAMSGGTMNHQALALAFNALSWQALRGKPCRPTASDFKIRVSFPSGDVAFYYPDGAITCVPIGGDDQFTDSPKVILEVLSPTTRRNDETQKLRDYLTIPSLQTYIMAEPEGPLLVLHRRKGDDFQREIVTGINAILELPEVGLSLPLAELYRDVR